MNKNNMTKEAMKHLCIWALFLAGFVSSFAQAPTPYECGFEEISDTVGWAFVNREATTTAWLVGNAESRIGSKALYVSTDGGTTASYNSSSNLGNGGNYIAAYKTFTFDAGTYELLFDWKAVGESYVNQQGQTILADAFKVSLVPASVSITAGYTGNFPAYLTNAGSIPFATTSNVSTFLGSFAWQRASGTLTVPSGGGTYNLVFVWKANSGTTINNPGACIDNIQIVKQVPTDSCSAKPTDFNLTTTNTDIVLTWNGNATTYSLLYFNTYDTVYTQIDGITGNSYSIPRNAMEEGVYTFRLRSVCANDSSVWVEVKDGNNSSYILVYDPALHCLDYLNFDAPGVTPTYGTYDNPTETSDYLDFGYADYLNSRHTVNYMRDLYDPQTNYGLRTIPEGEIASVRLGSGYDKKQAESITYTYTVGQDVGLLLMKYAIVFEEPGHSGPPRFTLEILDSLGQMIDPKCAAADFTTEDAQNWNQVLTVPPGESTATKAWWKDWTTIGLNIEEHQGETIKIRLTTYDCSASGHYGYVYFTLDCSDGKVKGISCGEHPDSFVVDQGFKYRWYKKIDAATKTPVVGRSNVYHVAPQDTATYYVDMMYPEDTTCLFTLEASALPRLPLAKAAFKHTPANCVNKVTITNNSAIFGLWEGVEIPTGQAVQTYEWDFGIYGTSTEKNPKNLDNVPITGDTIDVTLRVTSANGGCEDTQTFKVYIPAIGPNSAIADLYIHESELPYTYNNKLYIQAGTYTDSLTNVAGCDSTLTVNLKVLETSIIDDGVKEICSDTYYVFHGDTLRAAGTYLDTIRSLVLDADSIIYIVQIDIRDALYLDLLTEQFQVCADEPAILAGFYITSGTVSDYKIEFSDSAKAAGFKDATGQVSNPVQIPLGNVRAGHFRATLTFLDLCGDREFPITFTIQYPDSIITQRWNDVLSVRNSIYNGGYEFSSFQWYKDGVEIPGATKSYLYVPGELDFSAVYAVNLIQQGQTESIMSCDFTPERISGPITIYPTAVKRNMQQTVEVPTSGTVSIFDVMGVKLGDYNLEEGKNTISSPNQTGIYLYQIRLKDGDERTYRISVSE